MYNNNIVYTIIIFFIELSIIFLKLYKCYKSFKILKSDMQQYTCKQKYIIITKYLEKYKKNKYLIKVILMCNLRLK